MSWAPPYPPPVVGPSKLDRWWRRPWHAGNGRMPTWEARVTALLLASGSLLLLPGPVVWMASGETWAVVAFSVPALALQFLGWILLGADITTVPPEGGPAYRRKRQMWFAYAVSWIAFLSGVATLHLTLPELSGGPSVGGPWELFLYRLFPYIPSVFGAVVVAHAIVFLLGSRYISHPRSGPRTTLGATLLIALSFVGLLSQFLGLMGSWAYLLAGTAGFGYLLIGMAWVGPPQ